jgi:hypothetical protein
MNMGLLKLQRRSGHADGNINSDAPDKNRIPIIHPADRNLAN